jgi:hypothetical protein
MISGRLRPPREENLHLREAFRRVRVPLRELADHEQRMARAAVPSLVYLLPRFVIPAKAVTQSTLRAPNCDRTSAFAGEGAAIEETGGVGCVGDGMEGVYTSARLGRSE